jgi:hypothetical protein
MNSSSTHQFIDVEEVKGDVLVLKNKNLRMILMVSSINFALKSQDEQEAIINRFQDFINSFDSYTAEIVLQSRKLDISEYIKFLNERVEAQTNELLKIQTAEYITFIQELIKLSNVMSKFFYVVIPLNQFTVSSSGGGFFSKLFGKSSAQTQVAQDLDFETKRNNLLQRAERITSLLGGMGLKAIPLKGEELMELAYTMYNPGAVLKQKNLEQLVATGDEAKKVE